VTYLSARPRDRRMRSGQKSSPGRPPLGRGSSPPQHGLIMRERPQRRYASDPESSPKTTAPKRIFQPVASMRQFCRQRSGFPDDFLASLTLRIGRLTREGFDYPLTAAAWPQYSLHHSATARYLTSAQLSCDQWAGAHCCVRVICCLPARCLPVALTSEVPSMAPVARTSHRFVIRSASSAPRLRHARRVWLAHA